MKLLVILVVLALVGVALWQKWQRIPAQTKQMWGAIFGMAGAIRQAKKQAKNSNGNGTSDSGAPSTSRNLMLPCAQCGLHVPDGEGVHAHGKFYCSTEHAR